MQGVPRTDPRLAVIAAVLALGESPEGRKLCDRFVSEAERITSARTETGPSAADAQIVLISTGMAAALDGIAAALGMAADHAEFLAQTAARFTTPPPPREPTNDR